MVISSGNFQVDFFIVGMQRAATTSISQYLGAHPEIIISTPKEPHYFADDFPKIRVTDNYKEYQSLFSDSNKRDVESCMLGEASTGYLFSQNAIENINNHNPGAKIIVMLRNPVDMIHSLHAHLLFCGHEDVEDFEKAWDLQEQRKKGKLLPKDPRFHPFVQYHDVACIGTQVKRLLEIFPAKQVKFILFDKFTRCPESVYSEILAFLGLNSDDRNEFYQINQNMSYSIPFYYQIRKLLPWAARSHFVAAHNKLGIGGNLARRLFSSKKKSPRLTIEMKRKLSDVYSSEINQLSSLVHLNLDHWHD